MEQRLSIVGCGWLGFPLARSLRAIGYSVKGSTTTSEKIPLLEQAGIKPFLLRLSPEAKLSGHPIFQTDILILNVPPRNQNGEADYHERQLLKVRNEAEQAGVGKVVFVSSTGVYPELNRTVDEADADFSCKSRGGVSLVEAEKIFTSSRVFKTTVLRFGGLYGGDRHPGRFLAGKRAIPGAENPVNMIHLEDGIGVISAVIEQELWDETLNACSPNHPSRREFYTKAAADLGLDPPQFSDANKGFKKVSSQKLLNRLNYRFKY